MRERPFREVMVLKKFIGTNRPKASNLMHLALLLFIFFGYALKAQSLKSIEFNPENFVVEAFLDSESHNLKPSTQMPLASFEINGKEVHSDDRVRLKIQSEANFALGYKAMITFTNISQDTINLRNVVPLGRTNKSAYITGKGDHRLSRSHLFLPEKEPINCILPDNAWEVGYSGTRLNDNLSVCALTRRDPESLKKATRKRFETILEPGGSVTYDFYADLYKGEWQEGLRKLFQERYLYDLVDFDTALYEREDLKWIRNKYIMHLMMSWDKSFYDSELGGYTLETFLARGKKLYGGDDVIGLWPTWPTLGIDQRNQFDLFRDLPGGLPKIKTLAEEVKKEGTVFFVAYNPWDESTRAENHLEGMAQLIEETGASGVILDTKGSSSKEYQDAADKVKKGVIMYSEGMAVPKDMPGIVAGRVHNALYYPPLLNLNKFIKPDFAIFRVGELFKEPIQREFAIAFFNGHGTELNIFQPGQPAWVDEQYRYLGRTTRILRENSPNFNSQIYTPLVPTATDKIYVNKWPLGNKTIYTIFSLIPEGFNDVLFEVQPSEGFHFMDLWHHKELNPIEKDGKYYIKAEVDAFNKSNLGTNNEGEVGCVAKLLKVLRTSLHGDVLEVVATRGDSIKLWAGHPAYDKNPLVLDKGEHAIRLLEHFGRYEGNFVTQVFENGYLLDENIVHIKPGTPRLASSIEKTEIKMKAKGMVEIPAGEFTFKTTHGDGFIPYPDYQDGQTFQMVSFLMDKHPVTNADFKRFMDKSGYRPEIAENFLKHWENGNIPKGKENHPVVYVSYEDAKAYAKWADKRLPTEREWQYAAQAGDQREWPWSKHTESIFREEEKITETLTVFKIKGIPDNFCNLGDGNMDSVGKFPKGANPYGLEDLVGSVWQLTNDLYKSGSYDYIIMKGGSYYNPASSWWYVQGGPRELHYRQHLLRVSQGFERNATVGFRCVSDL